MVSVDKIEPFGYLVSAEGFLSMSVRGQTKLVVGDVVEVCEDSAISTGIQLNRVDRIKAKQLSLDETPALMKASAAAHLSVASEWNL